MGEEECLAEVTGGGGASDAGVRRRMRWKGGGWLRWRRKG